MTVLLSFGNKMLDLSILLDSELLHLAGESLNVNLVGLIELSDLLLMVHLLLVVDVLLLVQVSQETSLVLFIVLSESLDLSSEILFLRLIGSVMFILICLNTYIIGILLLREGSSLLISLSFDSSIMLASERFDEGVVLSSQFLSELIVLSSERSDVSIMLLSQLGDKLIVSCSQV